MDGVTSGALTRRLLLIYALPAFAVALPTIPAYVYLPELYGDHLGLGLTATGAILLFARAIDAVTDPAIGALSDRCRLSLGRRKPWIAVGAPVAAVGLVKLLNPPVSVGGSYLLAWSVTLYVGWTMVAVPYLAWGAELSANYDERTRVAAWREALGLLGIVGAGGVSAVAIALGATEPESMGAIAWTAVGFGAVAIPLLLWIVPDPARPSPVAPPISWSAGIEGMRTLGGNRLFLRLLSAWFLNGLANGVPAALFLFYMQHVLGAGEALKPVFILAYFVSAIVAIPLWSALSRQRGKHRVWCWAMIAACLCFAVVPLIPSGAFWAFGIVCVVTGMALGADLTLPPAIQADVVDYDRLRSGRARAGLQFALWGMATKLALALGVGLALPAVAVLGFDPAAPEEDGVLALSVIYSSVPVVIKVTAIALIWRFPLTARKHAAIRRRLAGAAAKTTEATTCRHVSRCWRSSRSR